MVPRGLVRDSQGIACYVSPSNFSHKRHTHKNLPVPSLNVRFDLKLTWYPSSSFGKKDTGSLNTPTNSHKDMDAEYESMFNHIDNHIDNKVNL